jgi:Fur family ferric uptake transcriptional regulator
MKPSGHSHSHDHAAEPLSDLTSRLRQKSRRITGPRQVILDLLRQHRHPMTNKEIHAALADGGCDLATIYRSMHLLTEMGMVKRFDFGDGVARFELVTCDEHAHHHHLICTCCAEVVEIDDCFAAELEARVAAAHGFKSVTHKLEFFGVCPECQHAGHSHEKRARKKPCGC